MRQKEFEQYYQQTWQRFDLLCSQLEERQTIAKDQDFSADYRVICHNLSLARERGYSPILVEKLQRLSARGHQLIYQKQHSFFQRTVRFISKGFPRLVRQHARLFWITTAIFYLPAILVYFLVLMSPDLVYSLMEPTSVADLEEMYNPANKRITENRDIDSDFLMWGFYVWNNVGIDMKTFAGGILAGIGSLFIVLFNGVYFGAVVGHLTNVGFEQPLFKFVIAHGAPELTGIVISGMAGFKIGWALIAPGNYSRKDALYLQSKIAIRLLFGAMFLTFIAAPIEAFWSSIGSLSATIKYSVGALCWLLVAAYLLLGGRHGSQ